MFPLLLIMPSDPIHIIHPPTILRLFMGITDPGIPGTTGTVFTGPGILATTDIATTADPGIPGTTDIATTGLDTLAITGEEDMVTVEAMGGHGNELTALQ